MSVTTQDEAGSLPAGQLPIEPMDSRLTSVQPGGGVIVKLELAWGSFRRWYLRLFRRGYVTRMRKLRQGECEGLVEELPDADGGVNRAPGDQLQPSVVNSSVAIRHQILDPRDLKYCRNQTHVYWEPEHDPFAWRQRLPFARAGLAELFIFSVLTFIPAGILAGYVLSQPLTGLTAFAVWVVVAALVIIGALIIWFFRDPKRVIPAGGGLVVSPADGKIVAIDEVAYDEFIDGPAVVIGIFLSIFNVHINRMPLAARVIGLRYRPGKYLNALRLESVRENEQLAVCMQENRAPYRRLVVRQIAGAIARRIVCWLKPGDDLERGQQFGMIKLGSRTELVLPREECLEVRVVLGQMVNAGSSILARYNGPDVKE